MRSLFPRYVSIPISKLFLVAVAAPIIILILSIVNHYSDAGQEYNTILIFMFLIIISYSSFMVYVDVVNNVISINLIHWFFILIFFGVSPFTQYISGTFRYPLSEPHMIFANVMIMGWCLIYTYGYSIGKAQENSIDRSDLRAHVHIDAKPLAFVLSAGLFISILLLLLLGFDAFLTRGTRSAAVAAQIGSGPPSILLTRFIRPIVLFCAVFGFAYVILTENSYRRLLPLLVVMFPVALYINNPMSNARFYAFAILYGIFALVMVRTIRNGLPSFYVLLVGLFGLQIFNWLRHASTFDIGEYRPMGEYLTTGTFDAYENFVHTIDFVNTNSVVYGRQFLGGILFFIPRSLWGDKPIGSGAMIYQWLDTQHEVHNFNVANPFISELFLNFHILGVILGAIVFGFIIGRTDMRYKRAVQNNNQFKDNRVDTYELFYPFLPGLMLLFLRGDFLSSYSFLVLFIFAFISVFSVFYIYQFLR
ncbi:hypothetical protein [Natronorubrum sp. DTA28]|uniref:hypothetical protein n=1 Tax=Natronorubrum sp. DTA28 TaxID=3447019 RepID=UPI003F86DC3E